MKRSIVAVAAAVTVLGGCGLTTAQDLTVGDCFDLPDGASGGAETEVGLLTTLSCAEPHDAEVFEEYAYAEGDAFPGEDAVFEEAIERCEAEFESLYGYSTLDTRYDLYALYPTAETWADGDRKVTCAAFDFELEKTTGRLADVVAPIEQ